eukprot:m.579312 g.579312  ORF g.579312 m.579312 type:complete len:113 (+) comp22314_c1_seq18:1396-1734(+)
MHARVVSHLLLTLQGVSASTSFSTSNLWNMDYSRFDSVIVFGVAEMMDDLHVKLQESMQPGSRMIVCRFPIPDVEPDQIIGEGIDSVWIYDVGAGKPTSLHGRTASAGEKSD